VFVIPWGDRVYVGTTDTDYEGGLDEPVCTAEDVDYLLKALNASITRPVSANEVLGTWAGLRPLVSASADDEEPGRRRRGGGARAGSSRTADLSRRHKVRQAADGLVTIVGGKLTTYRRMAEDTVDAVAELLRRSGRKVPKSRTDKVPLFGAGGYAELTGPGGEQTLGLPRATVDHLAGRYGGVARDVARLVADDPDLGRPLVPGLPYLRAEAVYAVRHEMALTLEDVLSRRTRALLLDEAATAGLAGDVAQLLAGELGWSEEETAAQVAAFLALVERQREAARPGSRRDPAEAALDRQVFGSGS
jgi:glycerol-3-phosphate dehydrogenase